MKEYALTLAVAAATTLVVMFGASEAGALDCFDLNSEGVSALPYVCGGE